MGPDKLLVNCPRSIDVAFESIPGEVTTFQCTNTEVCSVVVSIDRQADKFNERQVGACAGVIGHAAVISAMEASPVTKIAPPPTPFEV